MASATITTVLKHAGYSVTATRGAVYDILSRSEPLTMQQLIAALPAVNRVSVYRTVELFEKLGVIQKLQIGWKYKLELSNEYQEHHHHLTCSACQRTFELAEDDIIEQRLRLLARQAGFLPHDHQLEVRGLCADCAARV